MKSKYGIAFGVIGVCLAVAGLLSIQHLDRDSWFLFELLGTQNGGHESEVGLHVAPPEYFEISEQNLIMWMYFLSIPFGLLAICFALLGERNNEYTLFTAVGAFLGCGALGVISEWSGLAAMVLTLLLVIVIRSKRNKTL